MKGARKVNLLEEYFPTSQEQMFSNVRVADESKRAKDHAISKMDRIIEGTDLGIFMYFAGWLLVGILFTFSTNTVIQEILAFYAFYDLISLGFIIIQFTYFHKLHSDTEYRFMKFQEFKAKDFCRGIGWIGLAIILLGAFNLILVYSFSFFSSQFDLINEYTTTSNVILQVGRTIMTEELVFRGMVISLILVFMLEVVKLDSKSSIILSIILSGVSFGLIHVFRYGFDVFKLTSLMIMGALCSILVVKEGLWAGIVFHAVNNVFSIFQGALDGAFLEVNVLSIILVLILFLAMGAIYFIFRAVNTKEFLFQYFGLAMIAFFIIGFYSNGLIRSEDFKGLYFEHFHVLLFIPGIMLLFKNKCNRGKLYAVLLGTCFGYFISDYGDILAQTSEQWALTAVYSVVAFAVYLILFLVMKKNKLNVSNKKQIEIPKIYVIRG